MESEDLRTVWVGNLSEEVTEDILYELFVQAGPLEYVKQPKEKGSDKPKSFAFVCFLHKCSVPYAIYLLDGIALFNRAIKVQNRNIPTVYQIEEVGVHTLNPSGQHFNGVKNAAVNSFPTDMCSVPFINSNIAHSTYDSVSHARKYINNESMKRHRSNMDYMAKQNTELVFDLRQYLNRSSFIPSYSVPYPSQRPSEPCSSHRHSEHYSSQRRSEPYPSPRREHDRYYNEMQRNTYIYNHERKYNHNDRNFRDHRGQTSDNYRTYKR